MLQIAVIGVGAMGCMFAAHLSPFAAVSMFGHWPEQMSALREGLTLITVDGEHRFVKVNAVARINEIAPVDIALVLVKSYQTEAAARDVAQVAREDGFALTLQNGVGNAATLATVLGADRVISASTTEGATLVEPGVVRHAGRGKIFLPETHGQRYHLLLDFTDVLRQAGFTVTLAGNMHEIVWEKVAVNAAINPLTALIEAPNGFLLESHAAGQIARHAAREAALVGRALGYAIDADAVVRQVMAVAESTRLNLSSMLQDVIRGRPTEVDAITGVVIHGGTETAVPTPYNNALYTLLAEKRRGDTWTTGIASLPDKLQPIFHRLELEGRHAKMPLDSRDS